MSNICITCKHLKSIQEQQLSPCHLTIIYTIKYLHARELTLTTSRKPNSRTIHVQHISSFESDVTFSTFLSKHTSTYECATFLNSWVVYMK